MGEERSSGFFPSCSPIRVPDGATVKPEGLTRNSAAETYVETELEEDLLRDVREYRVSLVILCGNAGDGKTALLQHLASRLGLGKHSSSERVLNGRIQEGPIVRMNLDGSASWRGRSADNLLDEFLAPFRTDRLKEGCPSACD